VQLSENVDLEEQQRVLFLLQPKDGDLLAEVAGEGLKMAELIYTCTGSCSVNLGFFRIITPMASGSQWF
jgi:hypothetical protein